MVSDKAPNEQLLRDIYLAVHATGELLPVVIERVDGLCEGMEKLEKRIDKHDDNTTILKVIEERYKNLLIQFNELKEERKNEINDRKLEASKLQIKKENEERERKTQVYNEEMAARSRKFSFILLGISQVVLIILKIMGK